MITPVLYNLYISISEKRKAGFSLCLYASEKCNKTFQGNTMADNLLTCSNVFDVGSGHKANSHSREMTTDAFVKACQQLTTLTSLILSSCLSAVVPCVRKCPTRVIWVGGLWNRWNLWPALLTDGQLLQMVLLDV